mmetsp:Transcript_16000/g.60966  ORF Transcript_16000/g.60966 Transcript_16000/m.60966 type:complete len:356 (-) Transcript_16000:3536-4603(-)
MGACSSQLSAEEKDAADKTRQIDNQMYQDFQTENKKIKLLLLGTGESGKSTIFKQMKILYGVGFSEGEREKYKPFVYGNIIEAMKAMCEACEAFGIAGEIEARDSYDVVMEASLEDEIDVALGKHLATLWADPGIQAAWERRSEFQVVETTKTYFDSIEQIASDGYVPTKEHVLLARVRSLGITHERFVIDDITFELYDVGGQRNERKKWIHCFDDVNAVIYVAALSEYDQMLFEDEHTNRMVEALVIFEDMCNNRAFEDTAMILFLNKRDLFAEKVPRKAINTVEHFADFEGNPNDYDDGVDYFKRKFMACNKKSRELYVHVTCATDTDNVEVVIKACQQIILQEALSINGFTD